MNQTKILNYEFKSPCPQRKTVEQILRYLNAEYLGTFHHVDTYFNTQHGQLKIREAKKENLIMQYFHSSEPKARSVEMLTIPYEPKSKIKEMLTNSLGIKAIVKKKRRVYLIRNLRFHIDDVEGLGIFVEVRAENIEDSMTIDNLRYQCKYYQKYFKILDEDVTSDSYSDLLLKTQSNDLANSDSQEH